MLKYKTPYRQPSKKNHFLEGIMMRGVCLLMIFSVFSCNKTKDIGPETIGYDYYPIQIGRYSIYDVEEINYLVSGIDTSVYQIRETIYDSINSLDQTTYLMKRDTRPNEQEAWEIDSVWLVTKTPTHLSITENNTTVVKLIFPVSLGKEWDSNSLNSKNEHIYYYQSVNDAIIDSISSGDHIRVIIEDIEPNVTGVDLRSEVYVRGIGVVEKNYLTQKNCTASNCGDDMGSIIGGRSLSQTLIEIGNE